MEERTEEERDILREIGNIGGGNALTSLSMMLDRPLNLDLPSCQIVKRDEAGSMLKNPDSLYAGISMTLTGTVECMLVLLMNREFAELVVTTLDPEEPVIDVRALTDMQKSALSELGNIMGNSYITAIGSLLDLHIDVSVPRIVVDEGNRVLKGFLDAHALTLDKLLFINSAFKTEDKSLDSCMLLCPTDESLSAMLDKLSF